MTFGSLFSGIGGMDLGLERAGMTVRWQVEIDPFCNRVLERHWPAVRRHDDVRLCGVSELEAVDLIAGGFPCQDISAAGKGAGLSGERSGLWFEFLRIVCELRPAWVLAENVPALRTRGADVVLGGLEAEGYACWPLVVGARHVGAPHRRDRVWIVADAGGQPLRQQPGRRSGTNRPGRTGPGEPPGALAHGHGHGREGERRGGLLDGVRAALGDDAHGRSGAWPAGPGATQHEWEEPRTVEPPLGGAVDGLSRGLGRHRRLALKALGNAVVPQVAEVIGRAILRTASSEGSVIEPTS